MDIIINAQCIWYGQEQRIRFLYRFIPCQFFDELIRFGQIAPAEDRAFICFNVTKAISSFSLLSKVIPVLLSYQCKNGAAYRNSRLSSVPGIFPGFFIRPDLFRLLDMKKVCRFRQISR